MSKKKIDFLHQDNYLDEEVAPVIMTENNNKLVEENKKLKLENEKFKAEIEKLKGEKETLIEAASKAEEENSNKEEIENYINMAKRIQADFDNYRKRNVEAIKQAKEDLKFKFQDNDTSMYKDYTLDTVVTFEEALQMYHDITGACSGGTKHFVENVLKVKKKKYTIAECIELTRGQYNAEKFEEFFNDTRDE